MGNLIPMQRGPERFIPGPHWLAGIAGTVSFRISLSGNKVGRDEGRQVGATMCVCGGGSVSHTRENKSRSMSVGHECHVQWFCFTHQV